MKVKFLLAFTLMLGLAIGSANASPMGIKGNKASTAQNFNKDENLKQPRQIKHHHHYRRHHHHHMMKH